MKIDEVYIKEFGPYRDWSFTPKTDGVQLIYGPNESGKTSLLEAVRSFIFGKRGKTYKEGTGHVTVTHKDKSYHIGRRHKKLDFYPLGGETLTEEPSQLWWHGLDKKTYDRIFAITLEDLQGADILNEVDVRIRFFGGEGGEQFSRAVKDIDKAAADLLVASSNGKRRINVLMDELAQLDTRLKELGKHEETYTKLQQQLEGTAVTEKELRERIEEWREYASSIELVLRAWDVYKRAEEAKAKINVLTDTTELERDAFMALQQEIDQCREHMRIWRGKEEGLVPDNFAPDDAIGIYGQEIEDLMQEVSKWTQLQKECAEGERYLTKVREQLELSRKLHTAWRTDEEMPAEIDWRRGEMIAQKLRSAREAYMSWQRREPVAPADATLQVQMQKEEHQLERIKQGTTLVKEAYEKRNEAMAALDVVKRQAPSIKGWYAGAALAILVGIGMAAIWPMMPFTYIGWGLIVLGMMVGGYGYYGNYRYQLRCKDAESRLHRSEEQQEALNREYGLGVPHDKAAMDAIEEAYATLRGALGSNNVELAKLYSYEQQRTAWMEEGKALEQKGSAAMEEWLEWLPKAAKRTLTDSDFFGMKQEYDSYREQQNTYKGYEKRLAEHKEMLQHIESQARALWEKLEFNAPVTPIELRRLYSLLKSYRQNQARWEQKESQRRNYREEYDHWNRKEKELLLEQSLLLQKAGIATAGEYRQRLLKQEQYRQWVTIYQQSKRQLELLAPQSENNELLYRRLQGSDKGKWTAEYERSTGEIRGLDSQLTALYEERGQLQEAMNSLAGDATLAKALQQKAQLEGELRDALEDWTTQVLIAHFMEEAQQSYEKDRQPQALAKASEYIRILTDGKYRLDTEAAPQAIYLLNEHDERLDMAHWSSGLADQVYLALRLSLAHTFGKRIEPMPLILDDILVRFDETRQQRALALLKTIAEETQVWIFTCQKSTLELAKELTGITCYELAQDGMILA